MKNDSIYTREARVLQQRVETRRRKGVVVTSDELWQWIKQRQPNWSELDHKRVYRRVKL